MSDQDDAWVKLVQSVELDGHAVGDLRGGGGFGLVFEGQTPDKSRLVALKVLKPQADFSEVEEFEREGELLKALQKSSNVVDLISTGKTTISLTHPATGLKVPVTVRFHVLELSTGSLDEVIANLFEVSWRERINLWRAVVRGVHQMHLKHIVHRDIKSENCLLFVRKRYPTDCKVADLGRSRDLTQAASHRPIDYLAGRGDLRFAPPEFLMLQGADTPEAHKLADVYGLGSLLFELATGQAITSFALQVEPNMVMQAVRRMRSNRVLDLSTLHSQYQIAFDAFEEAVPKVIRQKSLALLKQLCDPVPEQRLPKSGMGRRAPRSTGLEWLINQADILTKMLDANLASSSKSVRRGAS